MSISVGALVEFRGDLAALGHTIAALRSAKLAPTSTAIWATQFSAEANDWMAKENLFALSGHSSLNQSVNDWLAQGQLADADFVWLLRAGDVPALDALAQLAAAAERAPSLGLLAPKLLRRGDPRFIEEIGLTLSPWGGLFSPAAGQLDQAQFDSETDSLALGHRGLLVRVELWRTLGGFETGMTAIASSYDFSIRARLAGSRVEAVAAAKVEVAPFESISATQKRRSELQLKFAFAPLFLAVLYWLCLPFWALARVGYQIAYKRLDLVLGEATTSFAAFFTPWRLFALRRRVSSGTRSQLRKLRAGWDEVLSMRTNTDSVSTGMTQSSVTDSGQVFWWLAALVLLNFAFWPTDVAATGGALKPLSESWLRVFAHAGSGWQSAGFGAAIPAHPVNWVLAAISATTFWQPSLAVGLLLLFSRAIAFVGVWRLATKLEVNGWVRHFLALAFAFWPSLTDALTTGNLSAVLALVAAPWLVGAMLSSVDAAGSKSNWQTQVGLAGLLLALVAAASPSSLLIWLSFGVVLLFTQTKRAMRLVWVAVPTIVLYAPYAWFMAVGFGHPALTLLDPLAPSGTPLELWQAAIGLTSPIELSGMTLGDWLRIGALIVSLTLLLASGLAHWQKSVPVLLGFWVLAGTFGWILSHTAVVSANTSQNPQTVLGLAGLAILISVGLTLREFQSRIATVTTGLIVVSLATLAIVQPNQVSYGPNRVLPAIVQAQWEQGNKHKVLQLSGSKLVTAELVTPENLTLDGQSRAYELSAAMRNGSSDSQLLAQLAANLVATSPTSQSKALSDLGVGFVFAPNPTGNLVAALDSSPILESVGTSKLGRFWRVVDADARQAESEPTQTQLWSLTKAVQFATLLVFGLIALPTVGRTRKHRDTELDEGESADAS